MTEPVRPKSLIQFLIVGAISAVLNYRVYALFYLVVMVSYEKSFIVGFVSGVALSYFLNSSWTFQVKCGSHRRDVWRYCTVYGITLIFGLFFIRSAVEIYEIDPLLANLGAIFVTTFINYIGVRFWVFSQ